MPGPIKGLKVLDLSRILAGPFCTMMLGDLGAEIIKVEQPGAGDDTRAWGPPFVGDQSAYYLAINRNKRSLTLDLKQEQGRRLLRQLVTRSDILVENFKVGTMERIGFGYDRLREINPRLIHCTITGYGTDGPYASRPGYDFIAQGMGGTMSVTGEPDGQPLKFGVAIADLSTGLYATVSILAALQHRDRTGFGQHVEVSLLESIVSLLTNYASAHLLAGVELARAGNAHPSIVPYRLFKASDKWFIVACGNDRQYAALCGAIGRPDLAADPRFRINADRVAHRVVLEPILADVFAAREAEHWIQALLAVGVPSGPVNSVADVFQDPQVLAREMLVEHEHPTLGTLKMTGFPFKFSRTPAEVRQHPPLLGEHTTQILSDLLGYRAEEIARLRAEGVV